MYLAKWWVSFYFFVSTHSLLREMSGKSSILQSNQDVLQRSIWPFFKLFLQNRRKVDLTNTNAFSGSCEDAHFLLYICSKRKDIKITRLWCHTRKCQTCNLKGASWQLTFYSSSTMVELVNFVRFLDLITSMPINSIVRFVQAKIICTSVFLPILQIKWRRRWERLNPHSPQLWVHCICWPRIRKIRYVG